MIEIIFDRNPGDTFLNEERPVFSIKQQKTENWDDYRLLAREILTAYQNDQIIIVRHASQKFSVNWLAAALFTESCFLQSRTEAVVFKTEDYDGAIAAYKPFVALTIGIKYVIRLYQEDLKNMYKDIASLSYLKLSIKEDYLANQLIIKLNKGGETKKIHAATAEEALTAIGIIKCLSLTPFAVSVEGKFDIADTSAPVDIDSVISRIIQYLEPFLNQN